MALLWLLQKKKTAIENSLNSIGTSLINTQEPKVLKRADQIQQKLNRNTIRLGDRNLRSIASRPASSSVESGISERSERVQKILDAADATLRRVSRLEQQRKAAGDALNVRLANADRIRAKVANEQYQKMIENHQYNHSSPLTDADKERYRLAAQSMGSEQAAKYLKGEYSGPYWGV